MSRTPKGFKGVLWGRATTAAGFRVKCHWCPAMLTYQSATVDHEPALAVGGTPRQVLACDACNQERSKVTNEAVKAKRRKRKR